MTQRTTPRTSTDSPLRSARQFLSSIATAQSQGTREQTDWMIEQAREGLERAGLTPDPAEALERAGHLERALSGDPTDPAIEWSVVALWIEQAVLHDDLATLEAMQTPLRMAIGDYAGREQGYIEGLYAVVYHRLEVEP